MSRAVEISRLPATVEDGLLTLQIWTVACAVWMEMTAVYDGLIELLAPARPHADTARLLERLRRERVELGRAHATVEGQRRRYADAYEQSRRDLRAPAERSLAEQMTLIPATVSHAVAVCALSRLLAQRFAEVELADERALDSAVELIIHYLLAEQSIVAAATELRGRLDEMHSRPSSRALDLGGELRELAQSETPYLLDALEEELGVRLTCTADGIDVIDLRRAERHARASSAFHASAPAPSPAFLDEE